MDKGTPFPQDADYESDSSSQSKSSDSDASEDDEEEAALLREYVKIKKEREDQQRKKEEEKAKQIEDQQNEELLTDHPLYNKEEESEGIYSLGRKWYDETVFKNQARIQKKDKKRFINDTVRSDFHRNFLNKFIQ